MILNALVERLKRRSEDDVMGRQRPGAARVIGRKPGSAEVVSAELTCISTMNSG